MKTVFVISIMALLSGLSLFGNQESGPTASRAASSALPDAPAPPDSATASEGWRIDSTGYLWFPGTHGNLNALGHNLGYKASAADILSHFGFGFMGLVGLQYKRLVLTSDLLAIGLKSSNTRELQTPSVPEITSEVKFREVMFTQKIGIRVVENEKIKIDALTGFRFWHLGTTLTVTPPPSGGSPYASQNWADPLVGGRIQVPLGAKLVALVAGDVGGWGAGSQLEYQIVGGLTYKVKPKWALGAAWRYLYLDYNNRTRLSSQTALSGVTLGVTYSIR